ncbi:MAG: hypothetical protein ABH816_03895 [Candidatus Levyibacteriota bacterium]
MGSEPKIIFEDESLLVLDKPAGMIVNRADTTKNEVTVQEWIERKFSIFNFQTIRKRIFLGGLELFTVWIRKLREF